VANTLTLFRDGASLLAKTFGVGFIDWLGGVPSLAAISLHLVTKLHHAAFIGFDLRKMESDVSVELLEKLYPIANQDRQDRITNFVG
jgi:hypothetical protein